jgi:hypothetical protein
VYDGALSASSEDAPRPAIRCLRRLEMRCVERRSDAWLSYLSRQWSASGVTIAPEQ